MGLRFRQRIKVFPGVHFNLSMKGFTSVSIGQPGATVNLGKGMRVTATTGLPGTGLSYRAVLHPGTGQKPPQHSTALIQSGDPMPASSEPEISEDTGQSEPVGASWTESSMEAVQALIIEAHQQHIQLEAEVSEIRSRVAASQALCTRLNKWYRRFFQKKTLERAVLDLEAARDEYQEAIEVLKDQGVAIDWALPDRLKHLFDVFVRAMHKVADTPTIWHVQGTSHIDRTRERTLYSTPINRTRAELTFGRPTFMPTRPSDPYSQVPCLKFEGGFALYFFPSFVAIVRGSEFGLIQPTSLTIDLSHLEMVEHEVPPGVSVTGHTWRYVNKDSSPDRRYNDNPQIPIVSYEQLQFTSIGAFDELFLFSGNTLNFATWVDLADWFLTAEKRKAMEALPLVQGNWSLRKEDDAHYVATPYQGDEFIGFGITHTDEQLWVCLTVSHLGFEFHPGSILGVNGTKFLFWLDDEPLVVGTSKGISCKVSKDAAACRAWPQDSEYPEPAPFKRLAQAKELFVRIENGDTVVYEARIGLSGVAAHMEFIALQSVTARSKAVDAA